MNITINNQPQSTAFGTLKLNSDAARRLAFEIHSAKSPKAAGTRFIKEIAEPIDRLKSTVTCNGDYVLLEQGGVLQSVVSDKWSKFLPQRCYDKCVAIFTSIPGSGYNVNRSFISFESSEKAAKFIEQVESFDELESKLFCAKALAQTSEDIENVGNKASKVDEDLGSKFGDYPSTVNYLLNLYA